MGRGACPLHPAPPAQGRDPRTAPSPTALPMATLTQPAYIKLAPWQEAVRGNLPWAAAMGSRCLVIKPTCAVGAGLRCPGQGRGTCWSKGCSGRDSLASAGQGWGQLLGWSRQSCLCPSCMSLRDAWGGNVPSLSAALLMEVSHTCGSQTGLFGLHQAERTA